MKYLCWQVLFNNTITYRLPVRNSRDRLWMPTALLRNGWQWLKNVLTVPWHLLCMSWLHPWNYTSLKHHWWPAFCRMASIYPKLSLKPPTPFSFSSPFHLRWAVPHTPAHTGTHTTVSGTPESRDEVTPAWWIWAESDGIAAMNLHCSWSSGPFDQDSIRDILPQNTFDLHIWCFINITSVLLKHINT